jgi:hypothetical protein
MSRGVEERKRTSGGEPRKHFGSTARVNSRPSHFVVVLGWRCGTVELEVPSTPLRAGSSLRLKNGCAQDDIVRFFKVKTQNRIRSIHSHAC